MLNICGENGEEIGIPILMECEPLFFDYFFSGKQRKILYGSQY